MAPDDLLQAVTRVLLQEGETRVQFEAEPTVFRWIFFREGDQVWIQLLQLPDRDRSDKAGAQIWSSWQSLDSLARALIRGFDDVAAKHGERAATRTSGDTRSHGPELEKLRTTWRQYTTPAHRNLTD